MTKEEVLALGVPEEKYKEFRELYNRDLNCRVTKRTARMMSGTAEEQEAALRSAIHAMLKMIKQPQTLESILKYINTAYYREV